MFLKYYELGVWSYIMKAKGDRMKKQLKRLEEVAQSLERSEHALALLALGSVGVERERMDEYSDLDFFVICEEGFKKRYIENLDWLYTIAPVDFSFQNTIDGHKLLFQDDVFCEFAVFEPNELSRIPFSKGTVVWHKQDFDVSICDPSVLEVKKKSSEEYLIGEALTNLYVGIGRYHRGEKLSAHSIMQETAIYLITELMSTLEEADEGVDVDLFNLTRRFEQRYSDLSRVLPRMLSGYDNILGSAEEILKFLDMNFNINQSIKSKILSLLNRDH